MILTLRSYEDTNVRQQEFTEMASHIIYLANVQTVEVSST